MSWFVLILLSISFFVCYSLLSRALAIKSDNPRAFAVVYNFFCSLIFLGLWLLGDRAFKSIDSQILFLTFIATVLWGVFSWVEYYAKKNVEESLLTIITKVAELTTFMAAILFLGEMITSKKILAATLILGANVCLFYKKKGGIKGRGLIYALITAIFLGLSWTMDKKISVFYPTSLYVLLVTSIPTLYIMTIPPLPIKAVKKEFRRTSWKVILLAFFSSLGYYFLVKSFAFGEASRIILVFSTRSIFTIIAAIIFLKERTDIPKKIIAGAAVTAGILLLK